MNATAAPAGLTRLLSDERLTRRAVGGDERAFAAIFRRYHQSLYRFCLAIVGNPEDAQDALQNTMMKVLRALPGEERKIELKPWLYRIAHNESIDLLRRRRETRELDTEQAAPGYGLAEDAATRERLRQLLVDLEELPERQRETLVMRELAGLGFDEIGTALGTSGAVARQTLYEARLSLRQMEEGREMSCDEVSRALSDGDGRIARRRDVRAHLRSCAGCRRFHEEIQTRQHDLAALSPLPAIAAAGILQGVLGGSQAAAGGGLAAALGGGAAQTIGASAAAKGIATAAVVAAVGVGAADRSGVIHVGLPGEDRSQPSKVAPETGGVDSGTPVSGSQGGPDGRGSGSASAEGTAGRAVPPGAAAQDPALAEDYGQGRAEAESRPDPRPQGPPEHASAHGHEKQHPEAAAGGQETAAEHKPALEEPGSAGGAGKGEGQEALPPKPSVPEPAEGSVPKEKPPKEKSADPPISTPDSPPAQPQPKSGEAAPEPAPTSGNAPEHSKAGEHSQAPEHSNAGGKREI
ncbi:MAG TPA: sigma-70 family RNA polymerase sigma factor [Solirubrobacterales bacterium]|nr:sigma-70 family RNA polymerase sigma factor [Solirubrobacterales bacterium]